MDGHPVGVLPQDQESGQDQLLEFAKIIAFCHLLNSVEQIGAVCQGKFSGCGRSNRQGMLTLESGCRRNARANEERPQIGYGRWKWGRWRVPTTTSGNPGRQRSAGLWQQAPVERRRRFTDCSTNAVVSEHACCISTDRTHTLNDVSYDMNRRRVPSSRQHRVCGRHPCGGLPIDTTVFPCCPHILAIPALLECNMTLARI